MGPSFDCRPECVLSSDCPHDKTCHKNKCVNPCNSGVCASNAICEVINHVPMCRCPERMAGNAFVMCTQIEGKVFICVIDLRSKFFARNI